MANDYITLTERVPPVFIRGDSISEIDGSIKQAKQLLSFLDEHTIIAENLPPSGDQWGIQHVTAVIKVIDKEGKPVFNRLAMFLGQNMKWVESFILFEPISEVDRILKKAIRDEVYKQVDELGNLLTAEF